MSKLTTEVSTLYMDRLRALRLDTVANDFQAHIEALEQELAERDQVIADLTARLDESAQLIRATQAKSKERRGVLSIVRWGLGGDGTVLNPYYRFCTDCGMPEDSGCRDSCRVPPALSDDVAEHEHCWVTPVTCTNKNHGLWDTMGFGLPIYNAGVFCADCNITADKVEVK